MDDQHKQTLKSVENAVGRMKEISREGTQGTSDAFRRLEVGYRRLISKGIGELTHDECQELDRVTNPVLNGLIGMEKKKSDAEALRKDGRGPLAPISVPQLFQHNVDDIQKQCADAIPVVLDYAERVDIRVRFNAVETGIAENKGEVEGIKNARVQSGVAQQSDFFGEEAKKHEKAAVAWGLGVLTSAVAFIVFALVAWHRGPDDVENGLDLALALANRTLPFVALGFGVFFCARNYMAHRHNAVINRHREKALETYPKLAGADSKSREIVLAYAARCIYAPQDSGFARRGESESRNIPTEPIRHAKGDE